MSKRGTPEWLTEPNELRGTAAGLPWRMMRHDVFQTWCGYVGLPANNSFHGEPWQQLQNDEGVYAPCHGGLTYGADHLPLEAPDGLWWFGFDCVHAYDLAPGISRLMAIHLGTKHLERMGLTYRNMAYVRAHCIELATWLDKFGAPALTGEVIDLERFRAARK